MYIINRFKTYQLVQKISFYFFLFLAVVSIRAQSSFIFYGIDQDVQSIRFQLVNNLIVVPININGAQLSFIFDTGVDKTILFNLSKNDSIGLNNVKKITLQGLGDGEPVEALLSQKNTLKIKNYISTNEDVYVILKNKFDISAKMGVTIHGVIGYQIIKDAVVKINYNTRKLYFYNPKTFTYNKCRRCETFPLQFYRNKPYLNAQVQLDTVGSQKTDVKLLIDTGGSDAIWLFEDTKEVIKTPIRHFKDILGEGLSGTIYGNRSRIKELKIGRFKIKNPTVSFLDSTSTYYARQFTSRNGSIGANILKRFRIWIDYPNKQITFKKSGSFNGGFEYNMSGIDVVYNGKILVKEKIKVFTDKKFDSGQTRGQFNTISFVSNYKYRFKPSYIIFKILSGSPADIVGLKKGDIIIKINGKFTHTFSLKQLLGKFQERHHKRIKIRVERVGKTLDFEFRLVKKI